MISIGIRRGDKLAFFFVKTTIIISRCQLEKRNDRTDQDRSAYRQDHARPADATAGTGACNRVMIFLFLNMGYTVDITYLLRYVGLFRIENKIG